MTSYKRDELEQMIKNGSSVMIGGKHVTRVEDLPSDVQMAGGGREKLEQAVQHLYLRRDALAKDISAAEAQLAEAEAKEKEAQEEAERKAKEDAKATPKRGRKKAEEAEGSAEENPAE